MEYRRMTEEDIPQIVEMEKAYFSDPWSSFAFQSELKNPFSVWIVAVDQGKVAGYVGSQTVIDSSDMMNIAVAESYRRQGVAQMLIEKLIDELKERQSMYLLLEVRVSNTPAISLYEKMGFQQIGLRPKYYHNPREDAYILRKELM